VEVERLPLGRVATVQNDQRQRALAVADGVHPFFGMVAVPVDRAAVATQWAGFKTRVEMVVAGRCYSIQLKSIQTNSLHVDAETGLLTATVQNDASDNRNITLDNGVAVTTTCYKRGEYDILAVPLFPFTGGWQFAYMRNQDCRPTESSKYPESIREHLLSTTEIITYPLRGNWTEDLGGILKRVRGRPTRIKQS